MGLSSTAGKYELANKTNKLLYMFPELRTDFRQFTNILYFPGLKPSKTAYTCNVSDRCDILVNNCQAGHIHLNNITALNFYMVSKKINFLNFTMWLGLPAIVLCLIIYAALGNLMRTPAQVEIVKPISPVKVKASMRDSIVDFGMSLLGRRYVAGACGDDGFDCSGFVYFVFGHFKVKVPRSSSQFKNFAKEVPIDSVRKGDILVFLSPTRNEIGHVGIVTKAKGRESEFIHASSGSEMKVIVSSLKQEGYTRRFVKAVDVL